MIDFGRPCRRQISVEKRVAMSLAVNLGGRPMKWTYLVKRSQITQTTVWPNEL
ncbi:hypothetical protein A2U01_0081618, partial [Trifolium medium]|nr:hypothetical protein [Trifolium medium]